MRVKTFVFAVVACFGLAASAHTELSTAGLPSRIGSCQVRIWSAHDVSGGRCTFFDEVMVGIRTVSPLVIRCGRLEVTCNRSSRELGEDSREVLP